MTDIYLELGKGCHWLRSSMRCISVRHSVTSNVTSPSIRLEKFLAAFSGMRTKVRDVGILRHLLQSHAFTSSGNQDGDMRLLHSRSLPSSLP